MAPRPLHIGLNLFYLVEQSGGAGTYAKELIQGILEDEPDTRFTAWVSRELPPAYRETAWGRRVDWVELPFTVTHGPPGNFALTMGTQWGIVPIHAAARGCDVIHGLANITPLWAPRVATVVTVLDLIWIRYPQTMARRATVGMKMVTPPSARRADRVIAISHAAKQDLVDTLSLPAGKIDVTHLGVRGRTGGPAPAPEGPLREKLGLGGGPVVLCVAQKREHKNLLGLVRAHAQLVDRTARLVLPGAATPHEAELRAEAARLGTSERVVFPAWLEREELEGLYALASCFVLPSFEEGFGLPILEAMARDVPVATSNCSSLPEVAGNAALLFDPADPGAIAACVDRLLADPELRATLAGRGRERVAAFPWRATAAATLEAYRRAIAQRGRNRWPRAGGRARSCTSA